MDQTHSVQREYEVGGDLWRVARPDLLAAEFPELNLDCLPAFHALIHADARIWRIISKLFGLQPVILPMDADPDDYRLRSRQELMAELGLTRQQLAAELNAFRGAVAQLRPPEPSASDGVPVEPELPQPPQAELKFTDEEVLDQFEYPSGMFEVQGRDPAENRRERAWFAARVVEWKKILTNPMAKALASQTLANELHLRRIEAELTRLPPTNKQYPALLKLKSEVESTYRAQLEDLDQIAPWMGAVGHKLNFAGVISDMIRGHQEYYASGTTSLVDGIFQATEIQVELRRSKQIPAPRYRAGLVAYLRAAREGLWDPHWKSPFSPVQLRAVDRAFKAAYAAADDASSARLPDLEAEGAENEYPTT